MGSMRRPRTETRPQRLSLIGVIFPSSQPQPTSFLVTPPPDLSSSASPALYTWPSLGSAPPSSSFTGLAAPSLTLEEAHELHFCPHHKVFSLNAMWPPAPASSSSLSPPPLAPSLAISLSLRSQSSHFFSHVDLVLWLCWNPGSCHLLWGPLSPDSFTCQPPFS